MFSGYYYFFNINYCVCVCPSPESASLTTFSLMLADTALPNSLPLGIFIEVLVVLFFLLFFFIHMSLSDYRSLHSSTHIYTFTSAHILSVYSAELISPSFSFRHKVYCTNVQPKVNPCPRHQCENTHLCSSLHVEELMCGRIEREAGSQGKEKHNNFVVRTPRDDGVRITRITRCG